MFFSPTYLIELRNYLFQTHADYERSLEIIIKQKLLSSKITVDVNSELFIQLSFQSKIKIAKKLVTKFPYKNAEIVNRHRNEFAHIDAKSLRSKYETKQLAIYEELSIAKIELNKFWELSSSLCELDSKVEPQICR